VAIAAAGRDAMSLPRVELVTTVRAIVADLSKKLVERWFAAPVNPIVVVRR
jgi:hypothetical protein